MFKLKQTEHHKDVYQLQDKQVTANARTFAFVHFTLNQSMHAWHHPSDFIRTYPEYEVEDEQQVFDTCHAALDFAHPACRFVPRARRFDQNVCADVQACLRDVGHEYYSSKIHSQIVNTSAALRLCVCVCERAERARGSAPPIGPVGHGGRGRNFPRLDLNVYNNKY